MPVHGVLTKIVDSETFRFVGLLAVLLSCFLLATYNPLQPNQTEDMLILNMIINAYFVCEFISVLIVLGLQKYFLDIYHILDAFVSVGAMSEIVIALITFVSSGSGGNNKSATGLVKVLRILRVMRIIRVVKLVQFLPRLTFDGSVLPQTYDLVLNLIFPCTAMIGFALLSHVVVGESLKYRCVPMDFNSSSSVLSNVYYKDYGVEYFYSQYNVMFCGYKKCSTGFSCEKIDMIFRGVYGDYSTPWLSFITNTSFLTTRNWSNIYWAIADSKGDFFSIVLLLIILGTGTALICNLFVPTLIAFMKVSGKYAQRVLWLRMFPGSIDSVSELELIIWARKNEEYILKKEGVQVLGIRLNTILSFFLRIISSLPIFQRFQSKSPAQNDQAAAANARKLESKKEVEKNDNEASSCLMLDKVRRHLDDSSSLVNSISKGVIVLNVLLFALNSAHQPRYIQDIIYYGNISFCGFFGCELLIRLLIVGPSIYFDQPLNVLDSFLVLFGLFSLRYPNTGCQYVTIFRVIFLFKTNSNRNTRAANVTTAVNITNIIGMVKQCISAIFLYLGLLCSFIYVVDILSMFFLPPFYFNSSDPESEPALYSNSTTAAPLILLEATWSGSAVPNMNFNAFGNAFVSLYLLSSLNSWYYLMVQYIFKSGDTNVFWFFFPYVYIANFMLTPILIAITNIRLETFLLDNLKKMAKRKSVVWSRMQQLTRKSLTYKYFHIFKSNALRNSPSLTAADVDISSNSASSSAAADAAVHGSLNNNLKNEVYEAVDELGEYKPFWERQMLMRKDYSLLFFSREGSIRKWSGILLDSILFNTVLVSAIVLAILSIVYPITSDGSPLDIAMQIFIMGIFLSEVLLKWISMGLFSQNGTGYFSYFLNNIDFSVCVTVVVALIVNDGILRNVYIFRLTKVPELFGYIYKSRLLGMIYKTLSASASSLLLYISFLLVFCFFCAVVGLQIYRNEFGRCSYPNYPPFDGRYVSYSANATYPNGCNGRAYIPIIAAGSYLYSTEIEVTNSTAFAWSDIGWINPTDHFDNIFNSFQSVFRLAMGNEWAAIALSALSVAGEDIQPQLNNSRVSFLFCLCVSALALFVNTVFAAILFYHYLAIFFTGENKHCFTTEDVIWLEMMPCLYYLEPLDDSSAPDPVEFPIRNKLYAMLHSSWHRALCVLFVVLPVVLVLGFYQKVYSSSAIIYVDILFNALYIMDFYCRIVVFGWASMYKSVMGKQEILLVLNLILSSIIAFATSLNPKTEFFSYWVVQYCVLLRIFRISVVIPQVGKFQRILFLSLNSFMPLLAIALCFLLFNAVVATISLGKIEMNFGEGMEFLTDHYHFHSYYHSYITLLAMATGNIWTEILQLLEQDQPLFMIIYIETFFTIFYMTFFLVQKSFAVLLIAKFIHRVGDTASILPGEQIHQFRNLWRKMRRGKNQKTMAFKILPLFLSNLKPPLGIKGPGNHNYTSTMYFAQKIMDEISRSMGVTLLENGDGSAIATTKKRTKKFKRPTKKIKVTFRQVILAAHRNALLGKDLAEDADFHQSRVIHKNRVSYFRLQIILLILQGRYQDHTNTRIAEEFCLLVQRVDPAWYKASFLRLIAGVVAFLRQSIQSYGFTEFDGFLTLCTRLALKYELRAAQLQLQKQRILFQPQIDAAGSNTSVQKGLRMLSAALKYETAVARLDRSCGEIYDKHIKLLWQVESINELARFDQNHQSSNTTRPGPAMDDQKVFVTAIAVDTQNKVYAAYSSCMIKVFSCVPLRNNVGVATSGTIHLGKDSHSFHLSQEINLLGGPLELDSNPIENKILSLLISQDCKKLFVSSGKIIFMFLSSTSTSSNGTKRGKSLFLPVAQFPFHTSLISGMELYAERFLIVAAQDMWVSLWSISTTDNVPLLTSYLHSPGFSLAILTDLDELVDGGKKSWSENTQITAAVAVGTAAGFVKLLGLPNSKSSASVAAFQASAWDGATTRVSSAPVSSLCFAWGLLYAASADGCISVYAIHKREEVVGSLQVRVDHPYKLVPIGTLAGHSAAISRLIITGGFLFSCSHDLSILPWKSPERVNTRTAAEFKQESSSGIVRHTAPIICMSGNNKMIASGDESGQVVVMVPRTYSEILSASSASSSIESNTACSFSFLEHDFRECLVPHKGHNYEEEVYLTITNTSFGEITIRSVMHVTQPQSASSSQGAPPRDKGVFKVECDLSLNQHLGNRSPPLDSNSSLGPHSNTSLVVPPNMNCQYRLIFSPQESGRFYSGGIQFIVNETSAVKVHLKGIGVKPQVRLEAQGFSLGEIIDLDSVEIGQTKSLELRVTNTCKKNLVLHVAELSLLRERDIDITPKCVSLKVQQTCLLTLTFSPKSMFPQMDIHLRFNIGHALYTLALVRSRSHNTITQSLPTPSPAIKDLFSSPEEKKDQLSLRRNSDGGKDQLPVNSIKLHRAVSFVGTPCPAELVNTLLSNMGWGVLLYKNHREKSSSSTIKDFLCLQHLPTGLFIDVCGSSSDAGQLSNCVAIDFVCSEAVFFELWQGHLLLDCGDADKEIINSIPISANNPNLDSLLEGIFLLELFLFKADGVNPRPSKRYAAQQLHHPDIVKPSPSVRYEPGLLRRTVIKLQKGYLIVPQSQDGGIGFTMAPRLDLIGIPETTTYVGSGDAPIATVRESFELPLPSNNSCFQQNLPIFSPASITMHKHRKANDGISKINSSVSGIPLQFTVTDSVMLLDAASDEMVHTASERHIGSFSSSPSSSGSTISSASNNDDRMLLLRPPITVERFLKTRQSSDSSTHVIRHLSLETAATGESSSSAATAIQVSTELHSVWVKLRPRIPCGAQHRTINGTLPSSIHSYAHSVEVRHIVPDGNLVGAQWDNLERKKKFYEMQNAIRSGYDYDFLFLKEKEMNALLDGRWTFLIDGTILKLVSSQGGMETDAGGIEISMISTGCIVSQLTQSNRIYTMHSSGRPTKLRSEEEKAKVLIETDKHRSFNFVGISAPLQIAPMFATELWQKIYLNSLLVDVKAAIVKIMDRSGPSAVKTLAFNSSYATPNSSPVRKAKNAPKEDSSIFNALDITDMFSSVVNYSMLSMYSPDNSLLSSKATNPAPFASGKNPMQAKQYSFEGKNPGANLSSPSSYQNTNSPVSSSSAMFYDRLYLLLAEITDQHYSTQLLGGSSSSSSSASSNNSKLSVLQCDRLALYLEQVPLPNVEQPLSSAEAEFVLESIPKDDGGQVSREHFRKWFDLSTTSEEKDGNGPADSSKKKRKPASNPSSSSVSGAGSAWARVAEAVKRNECRFFAQLLLEDYLGNQSHRLGEIERAAEDQANEMASSAPEVGTGPTSDMKKRSLQHKQHNKRKNQGQDMLLNSVNVTWNKRRFIPVTRKGHPHLGLLFVEYNDLASMLGPVVQVKVSNPEDVLRKGRRESLSNTPQQKTDVSTGMKVIKYRKVEIHKQENEFNLNLPSQAKYKTHTSQRRRPTALELSEEKDNNGHDTPDPLSDEPGQVTDLKGPSNHSLFGRLRMGISSAAADVFQPVGSSDEDDDDDDEDSDFDSYSGSSDELSSSSNDDEDEEDGDEEDYSSDSSSYSSESSRGDDGSSSSYSSSASALTGSTAQRLRT